jgi:hypothetical protein
MAQEKADTETSQIPTLDQGSFTFPMILVAWAGPPETAC